MGNIVQVFRVSKIARGGAAVWASRLMHARNKTGSILVDEIFRPDRYSHQLLLQCRGGAPEAPDKKHEREGVSPTRGAG
jgi:hypothetical protein